MAEDWKCLLCGKEFLSGETYWWIDKHTSRVHPECKRRSLRPRKENTGVMP